MKGNPDSVNRGPDIQFGRQKSNGKLRPLKVPEKLAPPEVDPEECDHPVRVADHMTICGLSTCPWRTCTACGNSIIASTRDVS